MANGEDGVVIYYITCGSLGYCVEVSCLSREGTAEEEATCLGMTAHELLDYLFEKQDRTYCARLFRYFLTFNICIFIFNLEPVCFNILND